MVAAMRVVEKRVERSTFGRTLAELREWIDRNGADPVKFESATQADASILVRLEFKTDQLASAFRRVWDEAATEGLPAAA